MAWFFSAIFAFVGDMTPNVMGPYATQQECEAARVVLHAKMSGPELTPCTRELISKMKGATKPKAD